MVQDGERVLFSTSPEYFQAAKAELLDVYAGNQTGPVSVQRLGPDLGRLSGPGVRIGHLARVCEDRPVAFVKHLTAERAELPLSAVGDLDAAVDHVQRVAAEVDADKLAVQSWVSGQNPASYGSAELARRCMAALTGMGKTTGRANMPKTLSLCLTRAGLSIGLASAAEQLSDWPGGRTRLARSDDQISRAEFKLEEAFQTFGIRPPSSGTALDLGASPGGWTRVLRRSGITVWAIDPGDLDDRLRRDRGVRHIQMTAGAFFRSEHRRFDMVVNDMKMDPELSCRLMLDAAQLLRPSALAVVTLKLSGHRSVKVVRECLDLLRQRYRVRAARQLHHNRHEVTVVAECR
ncbi:SAM-dependent methyltransferase [Saccharopolyspora thermophila]|uniref:SAM-dependent methyltransferase n=1 Tax=Saccharopolyspora thermophila TaxID=89367 RepID=UPI0031F9DB57